MKVLPLRKILPLSLILIACLLGGCWSPKKAKKIFAKEKDEAPFDVIIVPGYPHNGEKWDSVMMARVYWAKYLYEKKLTKNIIFSGSAVYTPYPEGDVMKAYAEALGIPPKHVFAETRAEHSVENVYYSILLGKDKGFKKFALATDPYQNYFMKQVYGGTIDFLYYLPFHYDILETLEMPEPKVNLQTLKKDDFTPLPEREGTLERWRGTLGRRVDFDKLRN